MSTPGQGSRWEGREAVSVSGKDFEWQGLLRCESCHGWTLHEGVHLGPRFGPWYHWVPGVAAWVYWRHLIRVLSGRARRSMARGATLCARDAALGESWTKRKRSV